MKITYLLVILLLLVPIVLAQDDNATVVVCTDAQCDASCVKCSDNKCHESGFICRGRVSLDDLFPAEIDLGESELTVLLRNTGNVDLKDVRAEVKGDGITLLDAESIPELNIAEEDYAVIKISAAKTGKITLLVKFFVNDVQLEEKQTEDITVKGVPVAQYNKTELEDRLIKLKQEYLDLEQEYQDKKIDGYLVDLVTNNLEELGSSVNNARDSLLEEDYKKATLNLDKSASLISDIKDQLSKAKKKEEQFGDKLKSYLVYAGSIAAAIISIVTAWKLTRTHIINKENLQGIHSRSKESIGMFKRAIKKEGPKKKSITKKIKEKKKIPENTEEL